MHILKQTAQLIMKPVDTLMQKNVLNFTTENPELRTESLARKQLVTEIKNKFGDRNRELHGGSFFDSYYTKVLWMVLLLFLDCSTLPLIRTL